MTEPVRISSSAARQQAAAMLIDSAHCSGPALFRALTRRLTEDLALQFCYVGEIIETHPETVMTHAFWVDGRFAEEVEYRLAGSAGEPAIRQRRYYTSVDVVRHFPDDVLVAGSGSSGFVAVPLMSADGEPIGLLAAGLEAAVSPHRPVRLQLELAAVRVAVELERVRTERHLSASQRWFRSVIESDSALTLVLDSDGKVQYASQVCRTLTGHQPEELVGQSVLQFLHSDDHSNVMTFLAELFLQGQPGSVIPCRVQHQDGSCQRFEIHGNALADDSAGHQAVIRCRPMNADSSSDRDERSAHTESLERLGTVAGCVAHDLRNLLAPILAYARTAKGHLSADHPAQSSLDGVVTSALHAGQLASQILNFSNPSQSSSTNYPVISLGRAVADALNLLRVSLPPAVDLRTSLSAESTDIKVDIAQLHQILLNLCLNAAQAMEQETGKIEIAVSRVQVDEAKARGVAGLSPGPYVLLTVSDNGQGMDEATQRNAFAPFFTTKAPGYGTGLGLVTVGDIVQRHAGSIRLTSQPGCGTRFELYFPAAAPAPTPAPLAGRGLDAVRILLVDDEEALLRVMQRVLTHCGAEVTECSNASAALECLQRATVPFHAVVTDLNMPGVNGCEFGWAVRRLDSRVRIIVTTGYCRPAAAREIEAIGNATVVDKTLIITDPAREISAALGPIPATGCPTNPSLNNSNLRPA